MYSISEHLHRIDTSSGYVVSYHCKLGIYIFNQKKLQDFLRQPPISEDIPLNYSNLKS